MKQHDKTNADCLRCYPLKRWFCILACPTVNDLLNEADRSSS